MYINFFFVFLSKPSFSVSCHHLTSDAFLCQKNTLKRVSHSRLYADGQLVFTFQCFILNILPSLYSFHHILCVWQIFRLFPSISIHKKTFFSFNEMFSFYDDYDIQPLLPSFSASKKTNENVLTVRSHDFSSSVLLFWKSKFLFVCFSGGRVVLWTLIDRRTSMLLLTIKLFNPINTINSGFVIQHFALSCYLLLYNADLAV